jgi:hypothetical protein
VADFIVVPCESCAAPIIWTTSEHGKAAPIDAEPAAGGNIALTEVPGQNPLSKVLNTRQQFGRSAMRMSHFATCPDAPSWRKRAKR